ncbi:hypothetical protein FB451DRAFT_1563854 [Mycena latifolia]|nr:hypothetical protein FB451DRAFT_1563854 [Mycena latifolia]
MSDASAHPRPRQTRNARPETHSPTRSAHTACRARRSAREYVGRCARVARGGCSGMYSRIDAGGRRGAHTGKSTRSGLRARSQRRRRKQLPRVRVSKTCPAAERRAHSSHFPSRAGLTVASARKGATRKLAHRGMRIHRATALRAPRAKPALHAKVPLAESHTPASRIPSVSIYLAICLHRYLVRGYLLPCSSYLATHLIHGESPPYAASHMYASQIR